MPATEDLLGSLLLELRRGTLVLCALSQLGEEKYGYQLVQTLTQTGVPVESGTLYPLLRRLEGQGVLQSRWDTGESKPRKYYRRTPLGDELYQSLKTGWEQSTQSVKKMLEGESKT